MRRGASRDGCCFYSSRTCSARRLLLAISLTVSLSASVGFADEGANEILDAAACPALFGDEASRQHNRSLREQRLIDVVRADQHIDVVHAVPEWTSPALRSLPGLRVLHIEGEEPASRSRMARMRLEPAWSAVCAPGTYRVQRDDALGEGSAVLAVLDEGLLLSHPSGLLFVPAQGRLPAPVGTKRGPPFRMIWRSSFALAATGGDGTSTVTTGARANISRSGRAAEMQKAVGREAALPRTLHRPSPRGGPGD